MMGWGGATVVACFHTAGGYTFEFVSSIDEGEMEDDLGNKVREAFLRLLLPPRRVHPAAAGVLGAFARSLGVAALAQEGLGAE